MARLSIVLTEKQDELLSKHLPWGVKQLVMSKLIDQLNALLEEHGPQILGLIMSGEFNAVTKLVKEVKE